MSGRGACRLASGGRGRRAHGAAAQTALLTRTLEMGGTSLHGSKSTARTSCGSSSSSSGSNAGRSSRSAAARGRRRWRPGPCGRRLIPKPRARQVNPQAQCLSSSATGRPSQRRQRRKRQGATRRGKQARRRRRRRPPFTQEGARKTGERAGASRRVDKTHNESARSSRERSYRQRSRARRRCCRCSAAAPAAAAAAAAAAG